jgi:hypothetical protein
MQRAVCLRFQHCGYESMRWYVGDTKHSDHKVLSRPCNIRHDSALKTMANCISLPETLCYENVIAIASLFAVVRGQWKRTRVTPATHSELIENS